MAGEQCRSFSHCLAGTGSPGRRLRKISQPGRSLTLPAFTQNVGKVGSTGIPEPIYVIIGTSCRSYICVTSDLMLPENGLSTQFHLNQQVRVKLFLPGGGQTVQLMKTKDAEDRPLF